MSLAGEIESITCGSCGKVFKDLKCHARRFCSIKCKNDGKTNSNTHWRWEKKKEMDKKKLEESALPRATMFVGGYDEGLKDGELKDYDGLVTADEGEIL